MKRATTIAATVLGLSFALASEAIAVPVTTAFTARIADGTGPVNGLVNLNFKIFDAASAGTMVWEEMHTGASADEGLVYVALGSIAPTTNGLDETVFTGAALFLEVTVNGDVQSPRVPILSVPYAVHAATADTLGSLSPGDVALSNHNHTGVYAPASHSHSEYALTTHDHAGVYAPAAHTHSEYALTAHNHSAANITSGTLDNARFSAYSDLSAEGYLDANATGDLLTRSQSDARYAAASHSHPAPSLSCTNVSSSVVTVNPDSFGSASVQCTTGVVTGGGCDPSNVLYMHITSSQPSSNGWSCHYWNRHTASRTFQAIARCCTL